MLIATWNVNGLRARLDFVRHWLDARSPDIVCLQELKTEDEVFPHLVFESLGYQAVAHGQKAWNGVAVLSRHPVEILQSGLPGREEQGARLLTVRTAGLNVTSIYVPNGKHLEHADYPAKLVWLDRLVEYARDLVASGEPVVIGGDYNLVPEAIDSFDEKRLQGTIFHTPEERRLYRRLLEAGLHDSFRELEPDRQAFSWWDYRGGSFHRGLGLRIDFLLATSDVLSRAQRAEVDREYRKKKDGLTASDHAPVLLEIT